LSTRAGLDEVAIREIPREKEGRKEGRKQENTRTSVRNRREER
jgi:hypothetical protein